MTIFHYIFSILKLTDDMSIPNCFASKFGESRKNIHGAVQQQIQILNFLIKTMMLKQAVFQSLTYKSLVYTISLTSSRHLGYDQDTHSAFVPNEEIRQELGKAVRRKKWNEFLTFQQESSKLLDATLDMDADTVARSIEKIHNEYASTIQYNNQNSLSSILSIGYLNTMRYYFKPIREFPAGRGFSDFVYLPKPEYSKDYPSLVVELKWNQNAQTAIWQIKNRQYSETVANYTDNILLVGISYDKKQKTHNYVIEKYSEK